MQPSVSTSYGRSDARRQQRDAAADERALRDAAADREHVGVLRVLEHAPERLGPQRAMEPLLRLLGQLVLACGEAEEVGAVEGHPARARGERQMQRGDIREAADDPRLAERVPIDQVVQPRAAVTPAEGVDHVDPRLRERPLQVLGALLVRARQVAVHLPVVGAEDDLVAAGLEVGGRLLDVRACLRRAGGGDDRNRGRVRECRRLDAGAHRGAASPRDTLPIASAISSLEAAREPSTSSTCSSATCSSCSGPAGSNQSATPVHWSRIA